MKKEKIRAGISFALLILSFLVIAYFVNTNLEFLKENLSYGIYGMVLYFFLITLEVVLAPTSLIPIIPLASALWGSFAAFLLTWIGWTLGSIIAFLIARRLGVPLLERITSVKEMDKFQRFIPQKNQFLGVIIIRLFIPFDIMSYVIGFFSEISLKKYALATLIGFFPSTFFLAYFGEIPPNIQLVLVGIGLLILIVLAIYHKKLNSLFDKLFKD